MATPGDHAEAFMQVGSVEDKVDALTKKVDTMRKSIDDLKKNSQKLLAGGKK